MRRSVNIISVVQLQRMLFHIHNRGSAASAPFIGSLVTRRFSSDSLRKETNYQFVDKVQIEVKGGKGGDGCISFEGLSPGVKRPDGGSGGRGGSVYLVADPNVSSLRFQTIHFNAKDGRHGGSKGATGRNGDDVFVKVPIGTIVSELSAVDDLDDSLGETDWESEVDDELLLFDEDGEEDQTILPTRRSSNRKEICLEKEKDIVLVAAGGHSGLGNMVLAGAKHQRQRSLPATKVPGQMGQARSLLLEMKTIADIGLVGYPNAGKSSLLRSLSNATPKVAAYPFTTLHPTVGMVEYTDRFQVSIADIPGLIDGAHENRGLGHDFLKHIERTKILLFVIDVTGFGEGREFKEPQESLADLIRELELYDPRLLERPMVVFANKCDTKVKKTYVKKLTTFVNALEVPLMTGSAVSGEGIGQLAQALRHLVSTVNEAAAEAKRALKEGKTM